MIYLLRYKHIPRAMVRAESRVKAIALICRILSEDYYKYALSHDLPSAQLKPEECKRLARVRAHRIFRSSEIVAYPDNTRAGDINPKGNYGYDMACATDRVH